MKIIGYSNPNNYFPSPLISFTIDHGNYHAIYPSGKDIILDNFNEIFEDIPHFIEQHEDINIFTGQYAYGIDRNQILIGRPCYIYRELEKMLRINFFNKNQYRIVANFIENTL